MTSRERDEQHDGTPAPPSLPRLLSVDEAAEVLSVDRDTVYRQVRDGKIPAVRIGRVIRIDIDQALEQLRVAGSSPARAGRAAAQTRRAPAAREPQGEFARRARGLPVRESATPGTLS